MTTTTTKALRRIGLLAFAALYAAVALGIRVRAAEDGQYKVGDAVAPFKATDLAGKEVALDDLKGQVVLLAFLAAKPACVAELPRLERDFHEAFKGRGLAVIGVMTDDEETARKFRDRQGVKFAVWRDEDGRIFDKFVDLKVPWYAVIDRDRKLRYTHQGLEKDEPRRLVEELLGK